MIIFLFTVSEVNVSLFSGGGDDDSTETTDTESEDPEKLHLSSLSWIGDMEVGVEKVLIQYF